MPQNLFSATVFATAATLASLFAGVAIAGDPSVTTRPDTTVRSSGGQQVASLAAIVPKNGIGTFAKAFDCTGSITRQGPEGALAAPVLFWLGVRDDHSVHGVITYVAATLELPAVALTGQLEPYHDDSGQFVGGRMVLDWPFADRLRTIELGLRREAQSRLAPKIDGGGMVRRRTDRQTYAVDAVQFDPDSQPKLGPLDSVSFFTATCVPTGRLSLASARG